MDQLIQKYNSIAGKISEYKDQLRKLEKNRDDIENDRDESVPKRIKNLEDTLERIDDYKLRIKGFIEMAEQHMMSRNELTIEAPPDYKVSLSRLKRWATMIDPLSSDDAYAKRLHLVAKCDELFLIKKEKEFKDRIVELKAELGSEGTRDIESVLAEIEVTEREFRNFIVSDEVSEFLQAIVTANNSCWYKDAPEKYASEDNLSDSIDLGKGNCGILPLGSVGMPFDVDPSCRDFVRQNTGVFFDDNSSKIYLPYILSDQEEFAVHISCQPGRKYVSRLDSGLRNLLLNVIDKTPTGSRRIHIFDAERMNTLSAGDLRKLEGTYGFSRIPRNSEQLTEALESLVAEFPDIDDVLENFDTVCEYNSAASPDKQQARDIVIFIGYPYAFTGRDRELVNKLVSSYDRYGISYLAVSIMKDADMNKKSEMSEYAEEEAVHIRLAEDRCTIRKGTGKEHSFAFYSFDGKLPDSYTESFMKADKELHKRDIGNDYNSRHDLAAPPVYRRDRSSLTVPYGIDGKDQEQFISFDGHNFAAYLIGQSGSGKSTLIHTIIAGILANHHPDNVELWLADFKQVEFKQYIDHRPPHVKYILLDESQEMVFDLIDKLNDEMLSRQQLLARLGKEKIEEIDVKTLGRPVPVIFVILDEFSIMSQAIEEDQSYRLKLQNLLAKGRALGFKFLFASQKFTSGITGLTPTAKDQIQQRIAMKASKEEINEVLALSPALKTEKVRNWIDAIPPYYALVKRRVDEENLEVSRTKVMYFSDNYRSRDALIDNINRNMTCEETFNYEKASTYIDKNPVIVDGNSYDAFEPEYIESVISTSEKQEGDINFVLGTPRLMSKSKVMTLSCESRENIMLIGRNAEQNCVLSIVLSIIKECSMQKGTVRIWAYDKNLIYRQNADTWRTLNIRTQAGMKELCPAIKELKERIRNGVPGNEVIIMLGMERIYSDFDYIGVGSSSAVPSVNAVNSERNYAPAARTPEEDEAVFMHNLDLSIREKRSELIKKCKAEGKPDDEIRKLVAELAKSMREEALRHRKSGKTADTEEKKMAKNTLGQNAASVSVSHSTLTSETGIEEQIDNTGVYNAAEDFKEIVKLGSRLGYHFVFVCNSAADFKSSGLKVDFFRHRLAFQLSTDDSFAIFNKKLANNLPGRTCLYDDSFERYSFRPYLHDEAVWDGWSITDNKAVSPLEI